jgi:hypothetical protein
MKKTKVHAPKVNRVTQVAAAKAKTEAASRAAGKKKKTKSK